ncbi:MAG: hypothetical protein GX850_00455 [Clostridiaceae bacterium]|nr:hypothetical protein [Clostridiaceae bacterium]
MDDNRIVAPDKDEIDRRMKCFRFFPLEGTRGMGDRFLQPWLYGHVYASGSRRRGELKRASKELKRFFNQRNLVPILEDAGEYRDELLESQLMDSAATYLALCRDDDGFGRKLFGLIRMKPDEREDKIIADVYTGMIPILMKLADLPERVAMIQALDHACRAQYPQRWKDMESLIDSMKDQASRSLFPPFESQQQGESECSPEQ